MNHSKHHQCTEHGASAHADQRQGHTGERNELDAAADGQKYLKRIRHAQTQSDQLIKLIL